MLTVLADPDHEEYEQVAEWIDPDFDPEAFSVEAVNKGAQGDVWVRGSRAVAHDNVKSSFHIVNGS